MCLSPITLKRTHRTIKGQFTDKVPCGKCVLCLKRRQNAWTFRIMEERKISTSACFVTLTYAEPTTYSFNGHPILNKKDVQNFIKRLRKQIKNSKIKYYACGEYGTETLRPHYHFIMFNLPQRWLEDGQLMAEVWKHGNIQIDPCTHETIKYVTKYVMKGKYEPRTDDDDRPPEFSLMSKKMGINYLTPEMKKFHKQNLISYVTLPGGTLTSLPRYFRDKIFTKKEKIKLSEEAELIRNYNFEKLFKNSFKQEHKWKKDQIRKQEKARRQERKKI